MKILIIDARDWFFAQYGCIVALGVEPKVFRVFGKLIVIWGKK